MTAISRWITDELRSSALRDAAVPEIPPEEGVDDLVHLAAQACRVPSALVTLVDRDRGRFAQIRDASERGADLLNEGRLAITNRPLRRVECKGRMSHDAEDQPVRFSGTAVDVTASKAAKAALREREERLALERGVPRAVLDQAPIGVRAERPHRG